MNISSKRKLIQMIAVSLIINGALPVIVYQMLSDYYSSFVSLLIATLIPLGDNLYHIVKYKKADAFGLFMLTGFILSLLAFILGGNERLILLRESMVTGLLGLIFIASLFFSKPLIYHFALKFTSEEASRQKGKFEKNWEVPYFRTVLRIMTAIWGIALLGEAIVKTILVYELSIPAFLAISQLVFYSVIGAAILFTVAYRRYAKVRLDKLTHI